MNKKGGLADSPFFQKPPPSGAGVSTLELPVKSGQPRTTKTNKKNKLAAKHDTVIPRHHDTNRDTATPRNHDAMIEAVRKAVKEFGKEAATYRFTGDEKKAIADLIYAYQGKRIKTTGNEITRIALNYIVHDYKENGDESILHQVIQALNA